MFPKPVHVIALENFRIWLKFSDTTEGIVDLSHLVNNGVFAEWNTPGLFSRVFINSETNAIGWNENLDLCPDSLYLQLKNITFDEWKNSELINATN